MDIIRYFFSYLFNIVSSKFNKNKIHVVKLGDYTYVHIINVSDDPEYNIMLAETILTNVIDDIDNIAYDDMYIALRQ